LQFYRRFQLAFAYDTLGNYPAADVALAELRAYGDDPLAYQIAQVYARPGEADKAFERLYTSLDNRDTGL
jgi:hypothetical protein